MTTGLFVIGCLIWFAFLIWLIMPLADEENDAKRWHEYYSFFEKELIDGTRSNGSMMRRRFAAGWQYRHMTPEEFYQHWVANRW